MGLNALTIYNLLLAILLVFRMVHDFDANKQGSKDKLNRLFQAKRGSMCVALPPSKSLNHRQICFSFFYWKLSYFAFSYSPGLFIPIFI